MESFRVVMVRADLANVPQHDLPSGYSFRLYRPGDAGTWARIWRDAEGALNSRVINRRKFHKEFGHDLLAVEKRCLFLVSPDGHDIGMTTAWYDHAYARKAWGLIHWVAITKGFQGRGLAKPMMTAAMNLLGRLGHRRAMLRTESFRLAALKVYLDFGFTPDLSTTDADRAWRDIQGTLRHPALRARR